MARESDIFFPSFVFYFGISSLLCYVVITYLSKFFYVIFYSKLLGLIIQMHAVSYFSWSVLISLRPLWIKILMFLLWICCYEVYVLYHKFGASFAL